MFKKVGSSTNFGFIPKCFSINSIEPFSLTDIPKKSGNNSLAISSSFLENLHFSVPKDAPYTIFGIFHFSANFRKP